MMSIWAPNATFTAGASGTMTGKQKIRRYWLTHSKAFTGETNWISDSPAYKIRIASNGQRGTLSFECHFIDVETRKVVSVTGADADVAKIDGRWLVTNLVAASPELRP